jgi:predicted Zn-dependent peptidase
MLRRSLTFTILALFLAAPLAAQEIAYEKYQLDNGLTVILHEDHSLPVACINTWYFVGGKDEPTGRSGFAHLFEHLMFMGTERVPGSDFDNIMEAGGGWNNASTGWDRTNYFSFGPSNLLPTLIWLDADRLEALGANMNEEKLEKQREVVLNERRQTSENQPYGVADLKISELMYPPGHPYHLSVIGTVADIKAATVQDVKDFFASFYLPNNASLVIAGDFDPAEIKPLVTRLFGTIPRDADPLHAVAEPLRLEHLKRVTYTDKVQFGRLTMAWHSPALFAPGDAEMDLAAAVLSSGKTSRLYKRLVYEDELATSARASQQSSSLGSLFTVEVMARQGISLDDIEKAVDEVLAGFVAGGPTAEELARHQAAYEYRMLNGLQSVLRKADQLNRYNHYLGEPNSFAADLDRYRNATADGIRTVVAGVMDPQARLIMQVLPEEQGAALAGRDQAPAESAIKLFQPAAPEVFTLSNGIEVRHWQRSELPLVELSLFLRSGSALLDGEQAGRCHLAAEMLDEGAGGLDALAFSDALDLLGANFSAGAGQDSSSVDLAVLKSNFGKALGLYADAVLRPAFDAGEWDRVKSLHLEGLKQAEDRPGSVASLVGLRAFYGDGHPYGRPSRGTVAAVEKLGLDDVKPAWGELAAPGNATFFIAGDLTRDEAQQALEAAFGSWANPAGFTAAKMPELGAPANDRMRLVLVDKPGSVQTVIRFYMPGPKFSDPRRLHYDLLNTILGGSFTSRLNQNLRERNGFTYGARSAFVMTPNAGYFYAGSDVGSEVTGAAVTEFFNEFNAIRAGDVSGEEMRKSRETNRMDMIQSFQGLGGLIDIAQTLEMNGLPFTSLGVDLGAIAAATEADLNGLAPAALPLDQALLVLVGDKATILEQIKDLDLPEPQELTVTGDPLAAE